MKKFPILTKSFIDEIVNDEDVKLIPSLVGVSSDHSISPVIDKEMVDVLAISNIIDSTGTSANYISKFRSKFVVLKCCYPFLFLRLECSYISYCFLAKFSVSYWRRILRLILRLFLIFWDFEARCSYKIVLIKKECKLFNT